MSPKAHFRNKITLEQVMNAPIIAWPLGLFDCCATATDRQAAIVVPAKMAKNSEKIPLR